MKPHCKSIKNTLFHNRCSDEKLKTQKRKSLKNVIKYKKAFPYLESKQLYNWNNKNPFYFSYTDEQHIRMTFKIYCPL